MVAEKKTRKPATKYSFSLLTKSEQGYNLAKFQPPVNMDDRIKLLSWIKQTYKDESCQLVIVKNQGVVNVGVSLVPKVVLSIE